MTRRQHLATCLLIIPAIALPAPPTPLTNGAIADQSLHGTNLPPPASPSLGRLLLTPAQRHAAEQRWRQQYQPQLQGTLRREDGMQTRWFSAPNRRADAAAEAPPFTASGAR